MPRKTKKTANAKTQTNLTTARNFSFSVLDGIVLVVFIMVVVLVGLRIQDRNEPGKVAGEETQETQQVESIKYKGEEGASIYDLLTKSHEVDADKTEFGVFVNGIGGVQNSRDRYWIYYVNGEIGDVAADKYTTKEGDEIEWRYQSLE